MEASNLNLAREAYIKGSPGRALSLLSGMENLDSRFVREEIENGTGNVKYLNQLISTRSNYIFAILDCTYHPYLALEYTQISDIPPSIHIGESFPNIRCVIESNSTAGINNEQVVALFPENFRSVIPVPDHPVFYFVNKFADRHIKYTRPLFSELNHLNLFEPLINLEKEKIAQLVANWVHVHESSHRTGLMPIPKYLDEKSNRYTASFEELRADLKTIQRCFSSSQSIESDEGLTGLFVLAERLLAYPLFRTQTNFDAISSVLFWKFLYEGSYLKVNEEMDLGIIQRGVQDLLDLISKIEAEAVILDSKDQRKKRIKSAVLELIGMPAQAFENYFKYWSSK